MNGLEVAEVDRGAHMDAERTTCPAEVPRSEVPPQSWNPHRGLFHHRKSRSADGRGEWLRNDGGASHRNFSAALSVFGDRLWPGVALGTFLVNASAGASSLTAYGMAAERPKAAVGRPGGEGSGPEDACRYSSEPAWCGRVPRCGSSGNARKGPAAGRSELNRV